MTKIKNTKKGMAKKTLSVSLAVAMLATSNVPVWAAEFSDGSDAAFTSEVEAPVVEESAEASVASTPDAQMVALDGSIASVPATASYGSKITPDYTGIVKGNHTLKYQWQYTTKKADGTWNAWQNFSGSYVSSELNVDKKSWVGMKVRVIAYATTDGSSVTDTTLLEAYGKKSSEILITPKAVSQSEVRVTLTSTSFTYDGTAKTPLVAKVQIVNPSTNSVVDTIANDSYEIAGYDNNIGVGTGTVTVTLKDGSGYTGSGTATFEITGNAISDWTVNLSTDASKNIYTFTGKEITPSDIKVTDARGNEIASTYYDVLPLKGSDKNVGLYYVTVVGKGIYNGGQKTSASQVKIIPKDVKSLRVVITPATSSAPTKVEVFDDAINPDKALTVGTDYTCSLTNDGVAGAPAYATITGKNNDSLTGTGNYKGEVTVDYNNSSVDISTLDIFKNGVIGAATTFNASAVYNGTKYNPITKGQTIGGLIEGRDFTATVAEGGTDAGKMKVVFEGKGYYTGTYTSYAFEISKLNLNSSDIEVTPAVRTFTYDPSKATLADYDVPEPVLKVKSTNYVLVKGTDYQFGTITRNDSAKTISIPVTAATGSKNITGSLATSPVYSLTAKNLADADVVVSDIPTQAFVGTAVRPEISLTYKGITYVSDTAYANLTDTTKYKKLSDEFTITYANNTAIGEETASITISPKTLNYTGKKVVKFSIGNATLEGGSIVNSVDKKTDLPSVGYDKDAADSKTGIVLDESKYLVLNKDGKVVDKKYYDVTFSNNKSVGTATITITGKNGYNGTLIGTYKIAQNSLPTSTLTITASGLTYTGSEITLVKDRDYTVTGNLAKLKLDTDYTIKYENNVDAGTAKLIVQGINNYYGTFTKTFAIGKTTIGYNDIEVGESGYAGGKAVEPKVSIKVPGTGNVLKEGTDYTVKYEPAAYKVGDTVTINITYNADSKVAPVNVNAASVNQKLVKVTAKDLKDVIISEIKDQEATDEQIKPSIVVMNGTVQMTEGKDYEVVYGTNKEVGEGTVTIKALDSNKNYVGEQTVKFNIVKPEVKAGQAMIETVNIAGNTANVVLSGIVDADGYDYVISTEDDYITGRVAINKNNLKTEADFYYLAPGTYYAYCHAWKRDEDGKKVFGDWSNRFEFTVNAVTPETPVINSVKVSGSTVTVTYTECEDAEGYDVVLGSAAKKVNGEYRPVEYGKLVKKNIKGNVVTATFKNVKKGTYYAGLHAFNRTSEDGKKVFSQWSNVKKVTVK